MIRCLLIVLSIFSIGLSTANAKPKTSDAQAREMFLKMYNMVYGPGGSALTYNVNIVGVYKTQGTIIYKGKKSHYVSQKHTSWDDGITTYKADNQKKEVHVYRSNDESKEKHKSKFTFYADDYIYSYTTEGNNYLITANVKKSSLMGVKWLRVKADKTTLYPQSITLKVGFVKTTVQISNFRSGKIADSNFIFPHEQYKTWKTIDHRAP